MTRTERTRESYAVLLLLHGARLSDDHIRRYTRKLNAGMAGNPNVRIDECRQLLRIWRNVQRKEYRFEDLSIGEKFEIMDAIEDDDVIAAQDEMADREEATS